MSNSCNLYCWYNYRRLFLVLSAGSIKSKANEYDFTAGWNLRKRNCWTKGSSSGRQDQERLSHWNCWRAEKVGLYLLLFAQQMHWVTLFMGLSNILYMYDLWMGCDGSIDYTSCLAFPVTGCRSLDQGVTLLCSWLLTGLMNILCFSYAMYWFIFRNRLHYPSATFLSAGGKVGYVGWSLFLAV